jgi:hypothetical protein
MTTQDRDFSIKDLFDFYYNEYKPLYSDVSAGNKLSQETLFEVTAAFDHVARHFSSFPNQNGNEPKHAKDAMAHIKRACLDMYKLAYSDTKEIYDRLCKLPIDLIDNGDFEKELHKLFAETRAMAKEARHLEGVPKDTHVPAFEVWQKAYHNCTRIISDEFFLNPKVGWAKRRKKTRDWLSIVGFIVGLWGLLVALGILPPLR